MASMPLAYRLALRVSPKQNGDALFVDMTSCASARYSLSLRLVQPGHYEQLQVEQVH